MSVLTLKKEEIRSTFTEEEMNVLKRYWKVKRQERRKRERKEKDKHENKA